MRRAANATDGGWRLRLRRRHRGGLARRRVPRGPRRAPVRVRVPHAGVRLGPDGLRVSRGVRGHRVAGGFAPDGAAVQLADFAGRRRLVWVAVFDAGKRGPAIARNLAAGPHESHGRRRKGGKGARDARREGVDRRNVLDAVWRRDAHLGRDSKKRLCARIGAGFQRHAGGTAPVASSGDVVDAGRRRRRRRHRLRRALLRRRRDPIHLPARATRILAVVFAGRGRRRRRGKSDARRRGQKRRHRRGRASQASRARARQGTKARRETHARVPRGRAPRRQGGDPRFPPRPPRRARASRPGFGVCAAARAHPGRPRRGRPRRRRFRRRRQFRRPRRVHVRYVQQAQVRRRDRLEGQRRWTASKGREGGDEGSAPGVRRGSDPGQVGARAGRLRSRRVVRSGGRVQGGVHGRWAHRPRHRGA